MMRTLDLRGRDRSTVSLLASIPRAANDLAAALDVAQELIADVVARGEVALRDQAQKFDGGVPPSLRVDGAQMKQALVELDPKVREGLELAIDDRPADSPAGTRAATIRCSTFQPALARPFTHPCVLRALRRHR
jgi:histidinol dehydrogenase